MRSQSTRPGVKDDKRGFLSHRTLILSAGIAAASLPVFAAVAPNPGGSLVVTNSTTSSYVNRNSTVTVDNYQATVLGLQTLAVNGAYLHGQPTYGLYPGVVAGDDEELVTQFNQQISSTTVATSSASENDAELQTVFANVAGNVDNSIDTLATQITGSAGRNVLLAGQGNYQQGTAGAPGAVAVNVTQTGSSTAQTGSTNQITDTTDATGNTSLTSTTTFGPGTILVGDNQGDNFTILAGQTDVNINNNTEFYANNVTTNTQTTTSTYEVAGYKIVSPIVLNLDGSGKLQASGGEWKAHPQRLHLDHPVMFDFYGNGFPVAMEWVGPQDGLLCQPKADGTVDGTCLFGTSTGYVNGFEQMASLDTNMDGHLTGRELEGLKVWQDKNGNGKAEPGELMSLKELGVTDINLRSHDSKGSFIMKGKVCSLYDWWPTVMDIKKVKRSAV